METLLQRSHPEYDLVVVQAAAEELIRVPDCLGGSFKCAFVLGKEWTKEWCDSQVRMLLRDGARVIYYSGVRCDEARDLADQIVIWSGWEETALISLDSDEDTITFLWEFRLVHGPPIAHPEAVTRHLIVLYAVKNPRDWLALVEEVFPV